MVVPSREYKPHGLYSSTGDSEYSGFTRNPMEILGFSFFTLEANLLSWDGELKIIWLDILAISDISSSKNAGPNVLSSF